MKGEDLSHVCFSIDHSYDHVYLTIQDGYWVQIEESVHYAYEAEVSGPHPEDRVYSPCCREADGGRKGRG